MPVDNHSPIVYVSYSYDVEEQTKLLEKLKEQLGDNCGFDLHIDAEKVRTGASFAEFMQEMERAKYVIVIASDAYFKSFYCMIELSKITQSSGLKTRIIPIWVESIKPDTKIFKDEISVFWTEALSKLETIGQCDIEAATLEGVKEIINKLEARLAIFGDLKGILYKQESDEEALSQQVERCVLFPIDEAERSKGLKRGDDTGFKKKLETTIQALLNEIPELHKPLEEALNLEDQGVANLATVLCEEAGADAAQLIDYSLFYAIQETHKGYKKINKETDNLLEVAKQLVSCLVLFSVEDDWIEQWSAETNISQMRMNLELDTVSGALIVTSRLHQRIPQFFCKEGTTKLYGQDELTIPTKQSGWTVDKNVKAIIQHIWGQLNPEEKEKDLNRHDYDGLNHKLESLYRRKFKQYYICNAGSECHYIADPNVLFGLQHYLPSLMVLVLEDKSGNTQIALQNDRELIAVLRDFLSQLTMLG